MPLEDEREGVPHGGVHPSLDLDAGDEASLDRPRSQHLGVLQGCSVTIDGRGLASASKF